MSCAPVNVLIVIVSFTTANETSRVADAGDPDTVAWTVSVWSGVTVVGVPAIVAVGPEFADNDKPVPERPGADQRIVRPEAAVALNVIGDG